MKAGRGRLRWRLLVFCVVCSRLLGQSVSITHDGDIGPAITQSTSGEDMLTLLPAGDEGGASSSAPAAQNADEPYSWRIGVYPALAWAPIFGASFTLPPRPSNPVERPSGSTDTSFNGAYFGGLRLEPGKWSVDCLFMWASMGAERKTPFGKVNLDFVFGDASVGHQVVPGLYVEGGFRRLALDFTAAVESESVSRSPGYWDPLIGLTYRKQLGKKWRVMVHGDGGGFGAGSDVDVTATGRAEWQFVRHCGLALGYGGMHFSVSNTVATQRVSLSPTLHGPILGLGIFF